MSTGEDWTRAAYGDGTDPSGTPWADLDPARLATTRTSIKWTRHPGALPLFVAEMDFAVAPEIRNALIERVSASDIGYLDGAGPLGPAFADFADARWGWRLDPARVHLTTDVATGVVEALRVARPDGGRLVLPTPTYPGFFEMLVEVPFEVVEVPLAIGDGAASAALDLDAIEREFRRGADAMILCNPQNPHGAAYTETELRALAGLAAEHDVFIVSDEIHAPLVHRGVTFTPFAPVAAAEGALSATTTSASKGWNLAGAKCAVLVGADARADRLLAQLPPETVTRASILGLHAGVAAFAHARDWLDRAIAQIEANQALLGHLLAIGLPHVGHRPAEAGYLAWLDLREAGLGADPVGRILRDARVALNDGRHFGGGGAGFARLNLACAPDTLRTAIHRIANLEPVS